MQIINYIQSEIISYIQNNYISKESDYYAIWEKQRVDRYCFTIKVIELNKEY